MSKVAKRKVCNIDGEDVEGIVHNAVILVDKAAANLVKLGEDEPPNKTPNKTIGWSIDDALIGTLSEVQGSGRDYIVKVIESNNESPESRPDPDPKVPVIPIMKPTFKIVWKHDAKKRRFKQMTIVYEATAKVELRDTDNIKIVRGRNDNGNAYWNLCVGDVPIAEGRANNVKFAEKRLKKLFGFGVEELNMSKFIDTVPDQYEKEEEVCED